MLDYAALRRVFAVTVAVPSMAAELVGGTVGLALGHAFEAAYTAQTIARIVNPITAGLKGRSPGVAGCLGNGRAAVATVTARSIQSILAQHQRQSSADTGANTATKVLNPFNGQPPGYNSSPIVRRPAASSATEWRFGKRRSGTRIPALAGLDNYTRDIAVDVTGLQNGKGKNNA